MTQNSLPIREYLEGFFGESFDHSSICVKGTYASFGLEYADREAVLSHVGDFYKNNGFRQTSDTAFENGEEMHVVTVSKRGDGVLVSAAKAQF